MFELQKVINEQNGLSRMDTRGWLFVTSAKVDIACDFLFAFLYTNPISEKTSILNGKNKLLKGSEFFLFRVESLLRRDRKWFERVSSPESISIPLNVMIKSWQDLWSYCWIAFSLLSKTIWQPLLCWIKMPRPLLIPSQSDYLILDFDTNLHI